MGTLSPLTTMITNKHIYIGAVLTLFLALGFLLTGFSNHAEADETTPKCTTSTVSAVPVGNQFALQVLATSTGQRAYAMLQQVTTAGGVATSSVSLGFNEDVALTSGNGIQLSTSTPTITFGLNTDFPYDGAVRAITDTGSTTLRVTECLF